MPELTVPTKPVSMPGYPPPVPPMVDADYIKINEALRDLDTLIGDLQCSKDGGAPCDEILAGCHDLKHRYELWKKAHFPGRP